MKYTDIIKKAEEELANNSYVETIAAQIRVLISGSSGGALRIPSEYMPAVERYCDTNGIPVYVVDDECLSYAPTYAALLAKEKRR